MAFYNMYLACVYKEISEIPFPSFDVSYLRKHGPNLCLFMLIIIVLNSLNSKLYKYVSVDSPAFAITFIIMPYMENQTAKLASKRISLKELGKKKGTSILRPDVLLHQLFKV